MQDNKICTLLIEKNSFFREGIKSLLADSKYRVCSEVENVQDLNTLKNEDEYKIIIYSTDATDEDICYIKLLKEKFPDMRVVVLSDNVDSHLIKETFSTGVDGLILKNIAGKAFVCSLNLIMMGEKIFPTSMISLINDNGWAEKFNSEQENDYDLSHREIDVIKCLTNGDTNKFIARELDITEETVKVHLKAILRKLGLCNRTQAAIWALSRGIVPHPEIIIQKQNT